MTASNNNSARAVFISYASEDAEAAGRIGASLEAAGIEVWLDRTVLRSGDAWDQKIRRQIRDCALFIAVISRHTEARTEGYFRLEWHLADQRTQLMARSRSFLVPVCVDDTPEKHADVPESFAMVHWTRLPAGETPAAFVERIAQLLAAEPAAAAPAAAEAAAPAAALPPRTSPPRGAALRWAGLVTGIGVLAAAALGLAAWRGYFWHDPLAGAQFARLTDWSDHEQAAAISRDGRTVAFVADRDGPNDVWITETGSGRFRNLTHGAVHDPINPEIRTLDFSADGSLVTLWARSSDGSRSGDINVMAVPAAGGALRTFVRGAAEVAWSSDGRRIVYHTTAPGDPIFVADASGGGARRIYTAPAGVHCHFQVWSRDDAFIYFARGVPPDHWDLWRIAPGGEGLERLTFHNSIVNHPVVLDAHTLLYLATDVQGAGPWLYGLDLRRRIPHRLSFGLERYTSLAASADGSRLAVTLANPSWGLWRVPFARGAAIADAAQRLSPDFATGLSPRSGPSYVLYVSRRSGRPGIWRLAGGSSRELWTGSTSDTLTAPAIAPDGRIAFTAADGERSSLYVMQPDGSRPTVIADSFILRGNAAWAPDGRSIIVAVLRDGEPRLMSFAPAGGAPVPLVQEYSMDPVWSPDGQFLLYAGAATGVTFPLRAADRDGRPYPLPSVMLPRGAQRVVFGPEPGTLIVLRGDFVHKDFWLIDLKSGAERRLTQLDADFDIRDFDLSADRSEILFDRVEESSTVALVETTGQGG
ncbi:MAG TPA: TIR domain-containing protein [Steroidobacteraceae bacterium]|nr:TIR domain-containing protein [Steroidobacteraceae bacterium]